MPLLAILAPGALAANLRDAGDDSPPLSCSWFGFAALFYAAVWFVVDVLIRRVAGVRPPQWGWAAVWALGLLALIAVNLRRMVLLKQRLREMISALACVLVLLQLCTAMIAQRFRVHAVPGHPVGYGPLVSLKPLHGIQATLHPRV